MRTKSCPVLHPKFLHHDGAEKDHLSPHNSDGRSAIEEPAAALLQLIPTDKDLVRVSLARARDRQASAKPMADLVFLLSVRAFVFGRTYGMLTVKEVEGAL